MARGRGRCRGKAGAKARAGAKAKARGSKRAKPESQLEEDLDDDVDDDHAPAEASDPPQAIAFDPAKSLLHEFPVFCVPVPKASRAKPGIRKPETFLLELLESMVLRLSNPEQHAIYLFFLQYLRQIRMASFCAGTDSPRLVMDEIVKSVVTRLAPRFKQDDTSTLDEHPTHLHAFASEL